MYNYEEIKPCLFTDSGQRLFLSIRDKTNGLLKVAGAVRAQEAMSGNTGSTWDFMACLDRMVELGELKEITNGGTFGQHRVFVSTRE